jgi:NADPH:quinone reductase-like Zn-dependent oxidoreductase
MRSMKALCTNAGIDALAIRDLRILEPGPREVRVRVCASALNTADQKVLGGEFLGNVLHGKQRPIVTGWDLAGTVEATGADADLAVGDEVFGCLPYARTTKRGAFAEAVIAPTWALARRPAGLSVGDACALATAGLTALQAIRDLGHVKPEQRVLVVGASGGVGALAVGVASKLGAVVTGICSSGAADFVRSLGATSIIVRAQTDLRALNECYHVILDAPAAHSFGSMRHLLAPGGVYISTLPGPGLFLSMALAPLLGKRAAVVLVKPKRVDLEQLASWAAEGMKIPVDSTFPVRDVAKALARLKRGGMRGRIVITVEDGF